MLVEGVRIILLRPLIEEEDRWRREGVGCVAPVIWWVGLGSEMSMGSSELEAAVELDEMEWLLATEADWARRAVSSRVNLLTWTDISVCPEHILPLINIPLLPALSRIAGRAQLL
jgi:hypothetical protein